MDLWRERLGCLREVDPGRRRPPEAGQVVASPEADRRLQVLGGGRGEPLPWLSRCEGGQRLGVTEVTAMDGQEQRSADRGHRARRELDGEVVVVLVASRV